MRRWLAAPLADVAAFSRGVSEVRIVSRSLPGTAMAVAPNVNLPLPGDSNVLASGGYAATLARLAGDGTN